MKRRQENYQPRRKIATINIQRTWMNKEKGLLNGSMNTYDGEEVCELVGRFLIYSLLRKYDKRNISTYRDDVWQFLKASVVWKLRI